MQASQVVHKSVPKIVTPFQPLPALSPPQSFNTYASRQRTPRRHVMGIAGVLVLHGLLLWAIQSGLARQVVKLTENTVEALLLSDNTPKPPPPPAGFARCWRGASSPRASSTCR